MLCGFANFASIGIQIGGIGSLAPGQRKTLSEFGLKALIGEPLLVVIRYDCGDDYRLNSLSSMKEWESFLQQESDLLA